MRRQLGFTVIEVFVVIAVMALILAAFGGLLGPSLVARAKYETRDQFERVRAAVTAAYEAHAMTIDGAGNGASLVFSTGEVLANGTTAANAWTAAALARMVRYGAVAGDALREDAGRTPLVWFVSHRLSEPQAGGYILYYRKVVAVSAGANGRLESGTTFDAATGTMTTVGDDQFVLIDGYHIQKRLAEASIDRAKRLARSYEAFYTARYLSHATRDVSLDYFASGGAPTGRWDTGSGVLATNGAGQTVATSGLQTVLGLANSDGLDGFGNPIILDNTSAAVRSPANPDPNMAIPPYTAAFRVNLPGGQIYTESAIGSF